MQEYKEEQRVCFPDWPQTRWAMLMLLAGRRRSPKGGLVGGLCEEPGHDKVAGIRASQVDYRKGFAVASHKLPGGCTLGP